MIVTQFCPIGKLTLMGRIVIQVKKKKKSENMTTFTEGQMVLTDYQSFMNSEMSAKAVVVGEVWEMTRLDWIFK